MHFLACLCLVFLAISITLSASSRKQLEPDISGNYIQVDPVRNRLKRSVLRFGLIAASKAVKDFIHTTRFLYSNGWDKIVTKSGGQKTALRDFEALNPTSVKESFGSNIGEIQKTGRIGRMKISLNMNMKTGSSTLRLSSRAESHRSTSPENVDIIVVYTD